MYLISWLYIISWIDIIYWMVKISWMHKFLECKLKCTTYINIIVECEWNICEVESLLRSWILHHFANHSYHYCILYSVFTYGKKFEQLWKDLQRIKLVYGGDSSPSDNIFCECYPNPELNHNFNLPRCLTICEDMKHARHMISK